VPNGFESFLARALSDEGRAPEERAALVEAAEIDAAWRRVFLAPDSTVFRPTAADARSLLSGRLQPSASVAVLTEHWRLLELRARVVDEGEETTVPIPERHAEPHHFALIRRRGGVGQLSLGAREARLFELLAGHTVGDALAVLEAECPEVERATLPAMAQRWLARSVELDFWSGIE
jgi:hypothetical protein